MKTYRGSGRALCTLEIVLPLVCAALITGILLGVPQLLPGIPVLVLWTASAVLAAVTLLIMAIWLPLWFRKLSYTVSDHCITRTSGVFFQRKQVLLTHGLQYSTIVQLPFARQTGMTFLPLHAYGGNLMLLFLSPGDAAAICNYLFDHLFQPPASEERHAP